MRVFVFEHLSGGAERGGLGGASLLGEGLAMLRAVAGDFVAAGVRTVTTIDARLSLEVDGVEAVVVYSADDPATIFTRLAREADATLVIAPETGGLLEGWCRRLRESGARSLGSSCESIALCGDKLALAEHLRRAGVPTPPTRPFTTDPAAFGGVAPLPAVVKPRDGAGCQDTFVVERPEQVGRLPRRDGRILQPLVRGRAVSASLIVHEGRAVPLLAGEQRITIESAAGGGPARLSYHGGRVPLSPSLSERALALAERAVAAVPGLRGFVGVDLVLADDPRDDSPEADTVIEVNPRLTTSYVGLRALCSTNLARLMLDPAAPLAWRAGRASFDGAGRVYVEPMA